MEKKSLLLSLFIGLFCLHGQCQTSNQPNTSATDSIMRQAAVVNVTNNYYQTPATDVVVHACDGLLPFCDCAYHHALMHYRIWKLERKIVRLF